MSESPRSAARIASVAMAIVLVALSASTLFGALSSYRAGIATQSATEVSNAFEGARYAIGSEESLERKYRLEPSPQVRARHQRAAATLFAALERARASGERADVDLVNAVLARHRLYLEAIDRMFAAIDAGDTAGANRIDASDVDPAFDAIEAEVLGAAAAHRTDAASHLEGLAQVQKTVLVATPIVFAFGMGLIVSLGSLLQGFRRRAEASVTREALALGRSERRFRALVQNASDVILICASDGAITFQSPTSESVWGYAADQLRGQPMRDLIHPDDQPAVCSLWDQLQTTPGATRGTELRLRDAAGHWRQTDLILTNLLHEPEIAGVVATARDITERRAFEEQLTRQAFYDSLTGLPNRALLRDRLDHSLDRAECQRTRVGLLFLDLDNFKQINDSLGHKAGDKLLTEAAARLRACVRQENTVARLGGDEFVILLEHLNSPAEAMVVAERIVEQFNRPFHLDGHEFIVPASIGIALGDGGQDQADKLLRDADIAMYRAKSDGKERCVLFDASMQKDALAHLEWENDLRRGIERHELRVYYQPIVLLETGQLTEVEALVRWQHPTRGLVPPDDFIAIAEETGLIVPLGQWVLEEACRQAAAWQEQFPAVPPLTVSVNLSPRQFQQPNLLEKVKAALRGSGLAPTSLKLEITEGVIMRDVEATITTLWQLKALGIQLAVDDFGTGYSSLAYLKRLPLDVVKIDRSFVNGIGRDQEDTAIVRAIISMAKTLNLSTTGEGIETAEQSDLLRAWACDLGQGFLFARPLDAVGLTTFLQTARQSGDRERAA